MTFTLSSRHDNKNLSNESTSFGSSDQGETQVQGTRFDAQRFSTRMAPNVARGISVLAVSALGFVGFLTLIGYLYEKFNRAEPKGKDSLGHSRHGEEKLSRDERSAEESIGSLQGELTSAQIVYLLGLLDEADNGLLEKILITLSKCCAFTSNQNLVRENGGIDEIMRLVDHEKGAVRLRVLQTLSNLAMNLENQRHIMDCIPLILTQISPEHVESTSDNELIAILQLLVNLTVVDTGHADLIDGLSYCLHILEQDSLSYKAKTNALRVLVNFSCNADNADVFFQEKRLDAFVTFLTESVPEDNMLRVVTILANIMKFECEKKDKSPQVSTREMPEKLKMKLLSLDKSENEEIREKVAMINKALESF